MKENKYDVLDEVVYSKELSNGFVVYFYPTQKTKNFYVTISVKYGAKIQKYSKNNKTFNIMPGSAHFLEHKVMNFESFDIMKKLGSVSNAYTNYNLTNYNIFGSEYLEDNLHLLLDLLFNPNITKENVESEKSIIKEEIDMGSDDISMYLFHKMRENLFEKGYEANSVIGKVSDIENITANDLNRIYSDFYRPDNMFMTICGDFDKDNILLYIENYFKDNKIKSSKNKVKVITEKDNNSVKVKYEELEINSLVDKVLVGIKIDKSSFTDIPLEKLDAYFALITLCKFSSTSKLYERYKNDKIMYSMSSGVTNFDDYYVINVNASVIESDLFIENIKKDIQKFDITKNDFERKKKKFISSAILGYETVENVESQITDEIISYNKLLLDKLNLIKKLKYEEALNIIKKLDLSNYSIIKTIKK